MDITTFFEWFLSSMIAIVTYCYNLLDAISIMGVSLLHYLYAIVVLTIVLEIFLVSFKTTSRSIVSGTINRIKSRGGSSDNE